MRFCVFLCFALLSTSCFAVVDEDPTWLAAPSPHTFSTGFVPGPKVLEGISVEAMPEDLQIPDHFDWREVGPGITPVKNQGSCGSCWAFASTAVMEAVFHLTGLPSKLSEQWLVSCDKQFWGCGGGDQAYRLPTSLGVVSEDQMPYTATNGSCKSGLTYGEKLVSWHYVAGSGGAGSGIPPSLDIAKAIYLYGPVSVAVAADSKFMSYQSGIYNTNSSSQINHLVTLVGYDLPGGYWIMKNSWGAEWGEAGYMRIKWKVNQIGDEAAFIKTRIPVTPGPQPDKPTCTLTASPAIVKPGESSVLTLVGTNGAVEAAIDGVAVAVNGGQVTVFPASETTYTGKVTSPEGEGTCQATVAIEQECSPKAKADGGVDQTIRVRKFATMGTQALPGHTYLWKSKRTGATWSKAVITVQPNRRGTWQYDLTATTKCGTATDSVILTVK